MANVNIEFSGKNNVSSGPVRNPTSNPSINLSEHERIELSPTRSTAAAEDKRKTPADFQTNTNPSHVRAHPSPAHAEHPGQNSSENQKHSIPAAVHPSNKPSKINIDIPRRATTGSLYENSKVFSNPVSVGRSDFFRTPPIPYSTGDRGRSSVPIPPSREFLQNEPAFDDQSYTRRLDRSPDSRKYERLPEEDRQLINNFRSAVDGVRSKLALLKQRVQEKYV